MTDNGIQFADLPKNRSGASARFRAHPFDLVCWANAIEHRLTKANHPWSKSQLERMNRTLKEAKVHRSYYQSHQQLSAHLNAFIKAYNFSKGLKTLRGLTPYECIVKTWAESPQLFHFNPTHHSLGLYS